ncbi:MAG: hypothetical protein ACOX41_02105 [Anaerovoracaceae bacterium]|jgi:hypothetical protein
MSPDFPECQSGFQSDVCPSARFFRAVGVPGTNGSASMTAKDSAAAAKNCSCAAARDLAAQQMIPPPHDVQMIPPPHRFSFRRVCRILKGKMFDKTRRKNGI